MGDARFWGKILSKKNKNWLFHRRRKLTSAAPKSETALRRSQMLPSTAKHLVKEFMLISPSGVSCTQWRQQKKLCNLWWLNTRTSNRTMSNMSDLILQQVQVCMVRQTNSVKSVWIRFSGSDLPSSRLHVVQIQFSTPTFDDIERDKKIKMEAQLSLIGGTMGLLTGFSIISGVEIIFFLIRSSSLLVQHKWSQNHKMLWL